MQTFQTPLGGAGNDQLQGIEESINSHLERMFIQGAKRSILVHGVGRTVSTEGRIDSKVRLHAQQRDCDATITFHAGRALELSLQLIYAYGTDRIMGREYPGVQKNKIKEDRQDHNLVRIYKRILKEMTDRKIEYALECAYQKALNRGIKNISIDGKFSCSEFTTIEDLPFREEAIHFIGDGMEATLDHTEIQDLIFPERKITDFMKMPFCTFEQFLKKSNVSCYGKNIRWADYSARDHEYGRRYVVVGMTFFGRLIKELVRLAHQPDVWHKDLERRWWERNNYKILKLLEIYAQQNFRQIIKFPKMISPEDHMALWRKLPGDPVEEVRRGFKHLRGRRDFPAAKPKIRPRSVASSQDQGPQIKLTNRSLP